MEDTANKWTDAQIEVLEDHVSLAYCSAQVDAQGKGGMPIELQNHR